MTEAPSNYTKRFPGTSLPEAIKANKGRKVPFPLLNAKTINDKYLSKLHSLLNWCVRNGFIPDNPSSGIKVDSVQDNSARPRIPFSPTDLTKLFGPGHFAPSGAFAEFEWSMLIALFSGTRASELAQMKLDSIRHERGILVFAEEEETKNRGSQQVIPVQKTLIELGREARVDESRGKGATHLLPNWHHKGLEAKSRAGAKGNMTLNLHFSRFIPKRFNDTYLRKVGI